MRRLDEIAWIRRFLAHEREGSTQLADGVLRVPAGHYTSPEHLDRERSALFRGRAMVAGLGADLPGPGDYLCLNAGDVPLLVTRHSDGRARAFVNACRHRGSPLADGRGCAPGGRLRCPFHAWSYSTDGRLAETPTAEAAFEELQDSERNLLPRPCAEAHGLVWVCAESDTQIATDEVLAGIGPDLDALDLGTHQHFDTHVSEWACNWKLLLSTFLESYHVFSLHRESVHPWYFSQPMLYDGFGPNLRFPVPKRSLLELAGQEESDWRLADHATLQWLIAPNALLSSTDHSSLLWRFEPLRADHTRVTTTLYSRKPFEDDEARGHLQHEFALQLRVTAEEDFPQQEAVQVSLNSGALPDVVMGRHEGAVIHFHRALAQILAGAR